MTAPDKVSGPASSRPHIVVIGAGVAGLAAARYLRAHHVSTTLIEALPRIGGRAVTARIGKKPFDLGATWLHDADRNPLVALADPAGLVDSDAIRAERLTIAGRPATPSDHAAYDAAWARMDALARQADIPDTTLAAALPPGPDPPGPNPWDRLVALWEGPIIAAADTTSLGLQDWRRNRLDGRNVMPLDGVGTLVARILETEATLATPATRIAWGGPGVTVDTPGGTIHATAAIVTVSTGVLIAGHIRFAPPLPLDLLAAIHALPMGLLSKIALPAPALALPPGTVLVDRDAHMTFNVAPSGLLAGFVGGTQAWSLARDPADLEAVARDELARILGADALRFVPPAPIVTNWGTDPTFRGAYAYAGPQPPGSDPRATLASTVLAGRLIFAGEAARTDGLAGTVAGAYLSGLQAAQRLMSGPSSPSPSWERPGWKAGKAPAAG